MSDASVTSAQTQPPAHKPQPIVHRCTLEEFKDRVDVCIALVGRGFHNGQIKRQVAKKYGCSTRHVEYYLRRAREIIREETGHSLEIMRGEAMTFYQSVLRDPTAKHRDKILARQRIDDLFGLDAPKLVRADLTSKGESIKVVTVGFDPSSV